MLVLVLVCSCSCLLRTYCDIHPIPYECKASAGGAGPVGSPLRRRAGGPLGPGALAPAIVGARSCASSRMRIAYCLVGHRRTCPRYESVAVRDNVEGVQLIFDAVAAAAALVTLIVACWRLSGAIAALDRVKAQLEETRVFNERFRAAGTQIGDERAAIRLAGVGACLDNGRRGFRRIHVRPLVRTNHRSHKAESRAANGVCRLPST